MKITHHDLYSVKAKLSWFSYHGGVYSSGLGFQSKATRSRLEPDPCTMMLKEQELVLERSEQGIRVPPSDAVV